ncbi:hypothetical protein [uncultured Chitinophaga sp.]|jgi:hypothetical protein|uniref:hypothetical protein n=1 Tax=uncultured Chitinophaga sp. TaxID=339340 RepID=UPI0026368178|nr:hypothetical protein [uncultured Chitinophaga sp.]
MKRRFDNLDLQSLYDLLAVQTKRYTSALVNGRRERLVLYQQVIDTIVEEIRLRVREGATPQTM